MKIALDVDGVVTEAPRFFAALSQPLRAAGHEIHIVTDFDEHFRDQRVRELAEYGVTYDHFVITAAKAKYCRDQGIAYMLEDAPSDYFPDSRAVSIGIVSL